MTTSGNVEQPGFGGQRAIPPDAVDRPVAGHAHEPGRRVGRDPVARPALRGYREGVGRGVLGEVEISTEEAGQRGQDPAPLVTEDLLDQRDISTSGRTSTQPPIRAAGMREARSIAWSRSSASSR